MYMYRGTNSDSKEMLERQFTDDYEATSFARDNAYRFPGFIITDPEGEIIDSNKLADDDEQTAMENMFPDEESMEGFDVDDFFDNN